MGTNAALQLMVAARAGGLALALTPSQSKFLTPPRRDVAVLPYGQRAAMRGERQSSDLGSSHSEPSPLG